MFKKFLSSLLIFFAMIMLIQTIQTVEAAGKSFAERTAGMVGIKDIRYSIGAGRLRLVLDITKRIYVEDYTVEYYENPSRIVVDIKNAWITDEVPRELNIHSTAVSRVRIAQNTPSQVRMVIDTMAENNFFVLDGGPAGYRLVVDIGADAEQPGFHKRVGEPMSVKNDKEKTETDNSSKKKDEKSDKKDKKDKDKKKDKEDKKNKKDNINKNIDELMSLEGKKIVIDPGHGGNDSGAIGPSGVMEKNVTLRVGLELRDLLEAQGAEVIMTRDTDVEVSVRGRHATDVEELKSRCDVANNENADIFISIHADSFTNPAARGTTGYYNNKDKGDSYRLADCIRRALIAQIETPSRGTQPCNFYVVRNTTMPATLVELAFISNPIEESLLNFYEGIQRAAQGIFDGIEDYFG